MPGKIGKFVKKCDIFGIQPQLYVKNASQHKSILGGFLSIVLVLGFMAFAIYTILSLEEFNFSSIKSWEDFGSPGDSIRIDDRNFLLMFRLNDPSGLNLINIRAVKFEEKFSNPSGITTEFGFKDCSKSMIDSFSKEYQPPLNQQQLKCLELNGGQLELGGEEGKEGFKSFYISVSLCEGGANCASPTEIGEFFKKNDILLDFWFVNYNFKPDQYEIVKTSHFDKLSYIVNSNDLYNHEEHILLQKSIVTTNHDFPFPLKDSETYSTYSFKGATRKFMKLKREDAKEILRVTFKKSAWNAIYVKTVGNISAILSYLGGLWNPAFLIIFLFSKKYNKYSYRLRMANEIYTFPKKKKKFFHRATHFTSKAETQRRDSCGSNSDDETNGNGDASVLPMIEKVLKNQQSVRFRLSDLCCCLKRKRKKRKLINSAMKAVKMDLDLSNILSRLQEIEKLKHLLLNKDQLFLFNFAPKPRITDIMMKEDWLSSWKNRYERMIFNDSPPDSRRSIDHIKKTKWQNIAFMKEIAKYKKLLDIYGQMKKELHANFSAKTARLLNLLGEEFKMILDPINNIKTWKKEVTTKQSVINAIGQKKKKITKRELVLSNFFKPTCSVIHRAPAVSDDQIRTECDIAQPVPLFTNASNDLNLD